MRRTRTCWGTLGKTSLQWWYRHSNVNAIAQTWARLTQTERTTEREGVNKWTDDGQTSGYIRVELVASCDRFVLTWIPCHHRCHWQRRRLYLWPGRPSLSRLYQTENLPFPYHHVTAIKVHIIMDVLYNMRGTYLIIIVKLQVTQTRL